MLIYGFGQRPEATSGSTRKYDSTHLDSIHTRVKRRTGELVKLLVTGGAGFIGSHFVDLLLTDPAIENQISKVLVIDKLTYAGDINNLELVSENPKFQFIEGDICDFELNSKISVGFDWIINFAAESHVDRSLIGTDDFVMTNVLGTVNLLNVALTNKIPHFLQVSTDEVYGTIEIGSWTEESKLDPRSPYSASKAAAELFCNAFYVSHNLDVRITRASNNFGPRQNLEKMIPKIVNNLKLNLSLPVYGDGLNVRDWIYVEDHCMGIWQAMQQGRPGQTYNLGGGTELTNLGLISKISKSMGISEPQIEFVEDRKGHDFRYSLNFDKASAELAYMPRGDFTSNLMNTISFYGEK
jgi:dTDP-glucose 4,6-dehydratase